MTGAIAAIWRFDNRPTEREGNRISAALQMYGAFRRHLWHRPGICLVGVNSGTLPEDIFDRQPFISNNPRRAMVATARLADREGLIADLGLTPTNAKTMSDANLLLFALDKNGQMCVRDIPGSYSFVIWDADQKKLICGRDALGTAPLYYYLGKDFIAVSSMQNGLRAVADIPNDVSNEWLANTLVLSPNMSDSPFQNVTRLRPGHLMEASEAGCRVYEWWQLPEPGSVEPISDQECAEQGRELFFSAVQSAMRSSRPISSMLSGGCDSGLVTAAAARTLREKNKRLSAYTAAPRPGSIFKQGPYIIGDETENASRLVAMHDNIDHDVVYFGGESPFAGLDRFSDSCGIPAMAVPNISWTMEMCDRVKSRGSQILLSGQLGNGTISHTGLGRLPELFLDGRWGSWIRELYLTRKKSQLSFKNMMFRSVRPILPKRLLKKLIDIRGHFGHPLEYSLIHPDFLEEYFPKVVADSPDVALGWAYDFLGRDERMRMIFGADSGMIIPGYYAATGVEIRDPTADQRLVEYTLGLSEKWYLKNGQAKHFLGLIGANLLPKATLAPGSKRGFQASNWQQTLVCGKSELMEELERLKASPGASRALDLSRAERLISEISLSGSDDIAGTLAYRLALSRGLAIGRFIRRMEGTNM